LQDAIFIWKSNEKTDWRVEIVDGVLWVVIANAAVWVGMGAYLSFLAARQRALAARLARWEKLHG
jgi:CcmD family protein